MVFAVLRQLDKSRVVDVAGGNCEIKHSRSIAGIFEQRREKTTITSSFVYAESTARI